MKTDVIDVSSSGAHMEAALRQGDKVAQYKDLSARDALHLRLLIEEMMAMMRSITGQIHGKFWIEDQNDVYELHLTAQTRMTSTKREQLLSVSTTGENESARGLMGRLRDIFDRNADEDVAAWSTSMMYADMMDYTGMPATDWEWTMSTYQDELKTLVDQKNENAKNMWDELEKSVVTHVADDIKVSIRNQQVEMVIYKKFD